MNAHLDADRLAAAALEGSLPAHAEGCESCRSEIDRFGRLVERLRALPDPAESLLEAAKEFFRRQRRLEALIERLAGDPALRAKAARKPEAVLREAGLEPAPELVELIGSETTSLRGDIEQRLAAKRLWF